MCKINPIWKIFMGKEEATVHDDTREMLVVAGLYYRSSTLHVGSVMLFQYSWYRQKKPVKVLVFIELVILVCLLRVLRVTKNPEISHEAIFPLNWIGIKKIALCHKAIFQFPGKLYILIEFWLEWLHTVYSSSKPDRVGLNGTTWEPTPQLSIQKFTCTWRTRSTRTLSAHVEEVMHVKLKRWSVETRSVWSCHPPPGSLTRSNSG